MLRTSLIFRNKDILPIEYYIILLFSKKQIIPKNAIKNRESFYKTYPFFSIFTNVVKKSPTFGAVHHRRIKFREKWLTKLFSML